MSEDRKYRIVREIVATGGKWYFIEIGFDSGIDGREWHRLNRAPFKTLNAAKAQINLFKSMEPVKQDVVWTE